MLLKKITDKNYIENRKKKLITYFYRFVQKKFDKYSLKRLTNDITLFRTVSFKNF